MGSAWQEIKALHKKSTFGAKEGLAFKYFSRPLASFILYFIKDGRITPNQVTILSLVVGIAGTVVHVTWLTWAGLLVGGGFFMLAHVLDALDGQLARQRKAGSAVGMHFDFFIDELKAYLMYGALAVRLYQQSWGQAVSGGGDFSSPTYLLTPLLDLWGPQGLIILALIGMTGLAVGISCTQFLKLQAWKEAFPPPATADGEAPKGPGGLIGLIEKVGHFVVDYPSYIIILCLANRVDVYVILYTLVVCAYAARALLGITIKLWRINPYAPKD